jgi:hypothetical protein
MTAMTDAARRLDRNLLPILVLTALVIPLARLAPYFITQDTWLDLVGGRWVVQHGLPQHDQLAVWTRGVRWIDQQWLAQLGLYEVENLGGIRLLAAAGVAVILSTLALSVFAARSLGASTSAAAAGSALALLMGNVTLVLLRAQSLALPLFALGYWLLASDGRKPSGRVLLVLPIIALWANLHGSVVLMVGLVLVRALLRVSPGRAPDQSVVRNRVVTATLLLGAPLAAFASPYGFALVHYYRLILAHPHVPYYVVEWKPAWNSYLSIPFFVLAPAALVLCFTRRGLSLFEHTALVLLAIAALLALRNVGWFGLAAAASVPGIASPAYAKRSPRKTLSPFRVAAAAATLLIWPLLLIVVPASGVISRRWPSAGAEAVYQSVRGSRGLVFADPVHSDWLIWQEPALAGRIAFDGRWELLTTRQVDRFSEFLRRSGPGWQRPARGYAVVTLDSSGQQKLEPALLRRSGARVVYRSRRLAVLARP